MKGSVALGRMVRLISTVNTPATMKAVLFNRFGAPDVLDMIELPIPTPGPAEVLIRIRAAGINFFETLVRQNRYAVTPQLPVVPGVEVAGVVEALGEGVDPDLIGKRVAVRCSRLVAQRVVTLSTSRFAPPRLFRSLMASISNKPLRY